VFSYGLAHLPLIGTLTTARLAKYVALAAIPHLLSSPFIIRATIVLIPSYLLSSTLPATSLPPCSSTSCSSCRIVQLPTVCRSESCANNLIKLVDLLDTSYLLSSTPPASSSTSYSSRLTCYHPRRQHPHRYPHRHRTRCVLLAIIHAAGILIDIVLVSSYALSSMPPASSSTSYSSRLTCYHPRRRHPHRHPHRHRTHCVLLAIIHAASILIDIVLVASYVLSSMPPASSSTSYSSRLTCYHPRRRHPHHHPHRHRTHRVLPVIIHAAGILTTIIIVTPGL